MSKLGKDEIKEIIEKLEKTNYPNSVEYLGMKRFKIQETYYPTIDGEPTPIPRDKVLLNEQGESISLVNSYDFFSKVQHGNIIVVKVHRNLRIVNDRSKNDNKVGLIDIDGRELVPCIYDSIVVKTPSIFLLKDGKEKRTTISNVLDGKFEWEKAFAIHK